MKKLLPVIALLTVIFITAKPVVADTGPSLSNLSPQDVQAILDRCRAASPSIPEDQCYTADADVEFAAKNAVRSKDLLHWTTGNYQWVQLASGQSNPFGDIWVPVRNTVYATLGLFVLAAAFLMIITRGRSLTVRKFIPRFMLVILLVTLSFSLVQFLYQVGDTLEGFFLNSPSHQGQIDQRDLLNITFSYNDTVGFRLPQRQYDEQVFITILMTKLTAISYYAIFGILVIRKIILWFFLVVSPVFPLLLLFPLIRNSAKIWIGEFFRWLLYAPLFALFLQGLVQLWVKNIPGFTPNSAPVAGESVYNTATDILLGGPGQQVGINNNLNSPESFIQYVIALLMLWVVIILPFILLKIFLDYIYNFSMVESNIVKYLAMNGPAIGRLNKYGFFQAPVSGTPGVPPPPGSPPPAATGLARTIQGPVFSEKALKIEQEAQEAQKARAEATQQATSQAAGGLARKIEEQITATNMAQKAAARPAVSETAMKMEANIAAAQQAARTAAEAAVTVEQTGVSAGAVAGQAAASPLTVMVSREEARSAPLAAIYPRVSANFERFKTIITRPLTEMTQTFKEALSDVFNITNLTIPTLTDVARLDSEIETREVSERVESSKFLEIINRIAGLSLIATPVEKAQYAGIREKLISESQKGNTVAQSIISSAVPKQAPIGEVNLVQQVNVDDYETVKKLWKESYTKATPPPGPDGKPIDRKKWLMEDLKKIPQVIDLLLSGDPEKVAQGKEMVSKILPFLLLGGFSRSEIIAYLKAKLAAAKEVLEELLQVEKDEENKVEIERKVEEKPKTMQAEALPEPEKVTNVPVKEDKK